MGVATFTQPSYASQVDATYKANIDGGIQVHQRIGGAFAPHAQSSANMTVRVDAGQLWDGETLTEVAAQNSATLVAPVTNPKRAFICINRTSGSVVVTHGAEAASPADPTIPGNTFPVARVNLTVGMTAIANSDIDDLRAPFLMHIPVFEGNAGVTGVSASRPGLVPEAAPGDTTNFLDGAGLWTPALRMLDKSQQFRGGVLIDGYPLGTLGNFTVNPGNGPLQFGTNNAAFTMTAPTADGATDILITNAGAAGTITFSGFTVGTTGDALTTTNGHRFIISIRRINGVSTYTIKALQ